MAYTTIFFDLDGTLIDPKDGITTSVQYALSKFGIHEDIDKLVPFVGPPLSESFPQYYGFDKNKTLEAIQYYRKYYLEEGIKEIELYSGVIELLEKLKSKNKKLSIVTSKFLNAAQRIVTEQNLSKYFDTIIATNLEYTNAGKPTLVKEALEKYSKQPKDSFVMIGDREHDVLGANANEIDSIGVLYGYGTEKELRKAKATYIAHTIKELGKLLLVNKI